MNPNVTQIMKEIYKYKDNVDISINFVTNGTNLLSKELIDLFREY
jgi:hypothetical protein